MNRRGFMIVAGTMFGLGAAVRIHNGLTFPVLGSYDAFGHFTYVWYVSETWRAPLPTSGWSFFHPPLYYTLMAVLWAGLPQLDPFVRLRIGVVIVATLSLVHAGVVWTILRRRSPEDRLTVLLASGLMLFIPVQLYSAAFLGNEGLAAVLCSLAFLALLARLRRPTWPRSLLLGAVLGLAMLTKVSALAVVVGAWATLALNALHRRRLARESPHLAVTMATMLVICGCYFARNVERYGTPFVMSRSESIVRLVENSQAQARRSLLEYLLFDPTIFRRPAWPRDPSQPGESPPDGVARALRESVWTGLYANTWFDGFGGWVVPRPIDSELSRRAGQTSLLLGILPTALVLVGIWQALRKLRRDGWDDVLAASVLTLGAMLVLFIAGTRVVPVPGAVKATYLMPVTVPFGVFFALGFARLRARRPALVPVAVTDLAVVFAVGTAVFWHGLLFDARTIRGHYPMADEVEQNLQGVVYYAAGMRPVALQHFEAAAAGGLHLGYENLALLALDQGRPAEALHLLKRATRLQPTQSLGTQVDRQQFDRLTQAEYLNLMAIPYQAQGRLDRALRAAGAALRLDPTIPEAHYDLAAVRLERLLVTPGRTDRTAQLALAEQHLSRALALDPGFTEARDLLTVARALEGDCASSRTGSQEPRVFRDTTQRIYPVETGTGAQHAASIGRRRHISALPDRLRIASCPQSQR